MRAAVSALIVLIVAAACGGGGRAPAGGAAGETTSVPSAQQITATPANAAFSADACKLLTSADVATIAAPTGPGQATGDATSSICTYPYGRVGGISLFVGTAVYGYSMPAAYDQVKAENRANSPIDVTGVGDAAFYVPALAELWFKKGGLLFQVKALGVPWSVDAAKGLALKVLARL